MVLNRLLLLRRVPSYILLILSTNTTTPREIIINLQETVIPAIISPGFNLVKNFIIPFSNLSLDIGTSPTHMDLTRRYIESIFESPKPW